MALKSMLMIVQLFVIAVLSTRVKGQAAINVITASEGDQVVLDCERPAEVPGIISWRHEGQTILFGTLFQDESGAYSLDTETLNHWKIIIASVNYARDGGMWFCSSDGVELQILTTIDLIVLSRAAPINGSITVTIENQGTSLLVTCNITADPPPHSYVIYQDGDVISNNNTAIVSPVPESCINFTCTASNELGNTTAVAPEYCPDVAPTLISPVATEDGLAPTLISPVATEDGLGTEISTSSQTTTEFPVVSGQTTTTTRPADTTVESATSGQLVCNVTGTSVVCLTGVISLFFLTQSIWYI